MNSTRRAFLQQALVIAGASALPLGLLTSCGEDPPAETGRYRHEPFTTVATLQALARAANGNLPARLGDLSAARDWRGAFDLLRQQFITLPTNGSAGWTIGCSPGSKPILHGPYATARAGAGSLLDQAMLLVETLTESGLEAHLLVRQREVTRENIIKHLLRARDRNFDIEVPKKIRQRLDEKMTKEQVPTIDQPAIEALASRIETGLGEQAKPAEAKFATGKISIPIVIVTDPQDGIDYALDLFTGEDPEPSQPLVENRSLATFYPQRSKPQVTVRVRARFVAGGRETTLLEHSYPVSEVLGRHLELGFVPNMPMKMVVNVHPRQLTDFTPVIRVARLENDPLYEAEESPVAGEPLNVYNQPVESDRGRIVKADPTLNGPAEPDRAATVTTVDLLANGGSYPDVFLKARLLDGQGRAVNGLSAANLHLTDGGKLARFDLVANQPKPHVVILMDITTSLPLEYRSREFHERFEQKIRSLVEATSPNATVTLKKGRDNFNEWLAETATKEAGNNMDLLVLFSDGIITDKYEEAFAERFASLPPIVFSYVGDSVHPDLEKLAGHLDITPVNIDDEPGLAREVAAKFSDKELYPYVIRYQSVLGAEEGTEVPVTLKVGPTEGAATYLPQSGLERPRLAGLYLDLGYYGYSRFVIAGYDPRVDTAVTEAHTLACQDALLSRNQVYLEGAGATAAVMLDDLYTAFLSRYPTIEALEGQADDEALDRALAAQVVKDGTAISLVGELEGALGSGHLTFPAGYRCCISQVRSDLTEEVTTQRVSLVDTAAFRTIGASPSQNFSRTIRATLQLANIERLAHETSTWSVIGADDLVPVKEFKARWQAEPDYDRFAGSRFDRAIRGYLPRGFSSLHSTRVRAPYFYAVHPGTGEVIAMLADGTGGGATTSAAARGKAGKDAFTQISNTYMALVTAFGGGSLGLGVATAYFQTLAAVYAQAAVQISGMKSDPCEFRKIVLSGVVNMTIGTIFGAAGIVGDVVTYASVIPDLVPDWGASMEGYCDASKSILRK